MCNIMHCIAANITEVVIIGLLLQHSNIQFTLNKTLYNIPLKTLSYISNLTSDIQQQINISNLGYLTQTLSDVTSTHFGTNAYRITTFDFSHLENSHLPVASLAFLCSFTHQIKDRIFVFTTTHQDARSAEETTINSHQREPVNLFLVK